MFSQVDAEFGHKLFESLSRYAWNSGNSSKLSKDAQNFAQIHFIKTRCTSKCSIHNALWLESWDIQITLHTMLSKAHMFLFKLRTQAGACIRKKCRNAFNYIVMYRNAHTYLSKMSSIISHGAIFIIYWSYSCIIHEYMCYCYLNERAVSCTWVLNSLTLIHASYR